jgi:hypothetical protein
VIHSISCFSHLGPALLPILAACASPSTSPHPAGAPLARAESVYADLRGIRDRIDVSIEAGRTRLPDGTPLSRLIHTHNTLRNDLSNDLAAIDSSRLDPEDARALGTMRRTLVKDPEPVQAPGSSAAPPTEQEPDCGYDAGAVTAGPGGLDSLRKRIYACYAWAQSHVVVDGDTVDRLSVLGSLGRTESSGCRGTGIT